MRKIKRIVSLFTLSAFMIAMAGSFTGCKLIYSKKALKRTITKALEEKYDEEFFCDDVWQNRESTFYGVCSPKENHDIRFEALFTEEGEIAFEGYYGACVSEQIEEDLQDQLETVFEDFYLHTYMTVPLCSFEDDDIYAQRVREQSFDIEDYVESENEKRGFNPSISIYVLVNNEGGEKWNYEEEYDMLSEIFSKVDNMDVSTIITLKFLPSKKYSECIDYLEICMGSNTSFKRDLNDYAVKASDRYSNISFEYEGETYVTLSKEDYVNQRKGV